MGQIIIARHAQDTDNDKGILNGRRDNALTATGVIQAKDMALKLRGYDVRRIITSPLRRAWHTADICSRKLNVPSIKLETLTERACGVCEGKLKSEIPKIATKFRTINGKHFILEAPGFESDLEICSRAFNAHEEVLAKLSEMSAGNLLVVSHGAFLRAFEVVHRGLTHEDYFDIESIDNAQFRVLD